MPAEIHARLVEYARAGGTVVVDKRFREKIPGAVVLDYDSRGQQEKVAGAMRAWARQFQSAHPEPLRLRDGDEAWLLDKLDGQARFVFVVNDHMVPGLLGAQKKLGGNLGASTRPLPDCGLAQRVRVVLPSGGQAVYNVRTHRLLLLQGDAADLELGPGDAAVLALLPEPIGRLRASAPSTVLAGSETQVKVSILSSSGKPLLHRDLLEVKATDAQGRALDVQRYFRVEGGAVEIPLRLALTQPSGQIKIDLLEWIAGQRQTVTIDVQPTKER